MKRLLINLITKRFKHTKEIQPLRSLKPKSLNNAPQNFVDYKRVKTIGGSGGDGCISFLSLWSKELAGPDGGDGGHGGHVIFRSSNNIKDLSHVTTLLTADSGEKGHNKDCHGKNANHNIVDVPVGTIIKDERGKVVGDLHKEGIMFVAARGGSGGRGNHFFVNDTLQAPKICEYGARGEEIKYTIELRSIAHIGLIGVPNAGKSTLLRAISRAKPKVAPYPFTTLKPHIGMVQYMNYEQIAVADLPGLIENSHQNKGLGIQFLKHVERCKVLLYVIDVTVNEPWKQFELLSYELSQFNVHLLKRPRLIAANKMDLLDDKDLEECIKDIEDRTDCSCIAISAKIGTNLNKLLIEVKKLSDDDNK